MKNIETLINGTSKIINDLTARLADYCEQSTYVCDAISEIVDSDCPIYWADLLKWFNEPFSEEYVNDAVNEYRPEQFDIMKAMQWGWCMQAEEKINEERDNGLLLACYVLIRDHYKLDEITDEQAEKVKNIDFYRIDTFADLQNEVENIINGDD